MTIQHKTSGQSMVYYCTVRLCFHMSIYTGPVKQSILALVNVSDERYTFSLSID